MTEGTVVSRVDDVPADSTRLIRVRDGDGDVDEVMLVREDDGVVAYLNRCMHFRHIRIDKGDGAPMRGDELVCENHAAMFETETGLCTYGPCEGARLDVVETATRDGDVVLVDDDYEYVGDGPIERDPADMTSRSNVEF